MQKVVEMSQKTVCTPGGAHSSDFVKSKVRRVKGICLSLAWPVWGSMCSHVVDGCCVMRGRCVQHAMWVSPMLAIAVAIPA